MELGEAFAHSATREPSDWNKRQALGCARNNRHRDRCAWGWHILKVLRARRRRCGWMKWVAEHHGWSSSRRVACGDEYPWKALVALCRSMQAQGDGGQGEAVPAAWRGFGKHRGAGEVRVGFAEPLRLGRGGPAVGAPRGSREGIAQSRRDRCEEEAVLPPAGCGAEMSARGPRARLPRAKPRPRGWQSRGTRRSRCQRQREAGTEPRARCRWSGGRGLAPGPRPPSSGARRVGCAGRLRGSRVCFQRAPFPLERA